MSWNGPGPMLVDNNALTSPVSENFETGEAPTAIPGVVLCDLTFTRNYVTKPLSYKGGTWDVAPNIKNHFEIKNGCHTLVEGNVFEYSWQTGGQSGKSMTFTPRYQSVGCPSSVNAIPQAEVLDTTVRYNVFLHVGIGIGMVGYDNCEPLPNTLRGSRWSIHDNLFLDIGGTWGPGYGYDSNMSPDTITVNHNTVFSTGDGSLFEDNVTSNGKTYFTMSGPLVMTNELMAGQGIAHWECPDVGLGTVCFDKWDAAGNSTFQKNVMVGLTGQRSTYTGSAACTIGGGCNPSSISSVGLVDSANCNGGTYSTSACALAAGSPYMSAGTEGKDIGADIGMLASKTSCSQAGFP